MNSSTADRPLGNAVPVAGGIDLDLPGHGVRLRATRWPGRGTPVLLLHGLGSQRRFWNLVVPGLAGLPVAALDQRGHGDSERPDGPYPVAASAQDAATAMDALGWDRAVVVGHSWGGAVALYFAATHPDRTLAVVAVDGGLGGVAALDGVAALGGMAGPGGTAGPGVATLDGRLDRVEVRTRLAPPRLELPPDELLALLAQGPLAPWWTGAHADAVLPAFALGPDGLARPRLDRERHLTVLDGLLDYDAEAILAAVHCPAWSVFCEPVPGTKAADDPEADELWCAARELGWDRAGRLARPRRLRWTGAVHDVPLQWPALVCGLVRAAVDDVSAGVGVRRPEGGPG